MRASGPAGTFSAEMMRTRSALAVLLVAVCAGLLWLPDGKNRTQRRDSGPTAPHLAGQASNSGANVPPVAPRREPARLDDLAGTVVDSAGNPVEGARVRWREAGDHNTPWSTAPTIVAATGSDGRFWTAAKQSKLYEVLAQKEGYAEGHGFTRLGDHRFTLRLSAPASLSGRVVLPDGAPAAGTELYIANLSLYVECADDGSFRLDGIPPGASELRCYYSGPVNLPQAPDYLYGRFEWPLDLKPNEERRGVELRIAQVAYSWVPLRLLDHNGAAIVGARVDTGTLSTIDEDDGDGLEPVTDAEGFVFIRTADYPGYEVKLTIRFAGDDPPQTRTRRIATLPPGTKDEVVLRLGRLIRVSIVVRDHKGGPIPDAADLWIRGGEQDPVREDKTADGAHRFDFDIDPDDADAPFDYGATADGYADVGGYADFYVSPWMPKPEGETIEIRMAPEAIMSGRLVGPDGKPIAKASVNGSWTDEHGRFECYGLPAGPATLRVPIPGPVSGILLKRELDLHVGRNELGDLNVPPLQRYEGRVVDTRGVAIGGALIQSSAYVSTVSRADGSFTLPLRQLQGLFVFASKGDIVSACVQLGTVFPPQLVMQAAARIEFQYGPRHWYGMSVKCNGANLSGGLEYWGWERDAKRGVVTISGLPPGPLRFVLFSENGNPVADRRVTLSPGQTLRLR